MSYSSQNLNYAFNVEYYSNIKLMGADAANRDIVKIPTKKAVCYTGEQSFDLQTCYPGLLIGIGNFHGAGEKGELDGGFSLDYVTGAPYIPASSLKGVLRSAFEHEEYIKEMLGEEIDVKALRDEIFEGKKNGEEIPMYERDVFFDAYPEAEGKCIMGIESITPHDGEFKSPNPLSFLKVLPRVVFRFSFNLCDGAITKDKKLALFKAIIKDFGLGAKTNVGFGAFEDKNDDKRFVEREEKTAVVKNEKREPYEKREVTRIECKECGTLNFKYRPNTQEVWWNWEKNSCRNCRKEFR